MAKCPRCSRSISSKIIVRKTLSSSRDPWAGFSCAGCGAALRLKRDRFFIVNFTSLLIPMLLMPVARDRGVGFGLRLVLFVVSLFVLRMLLGALLFSFAPREL
jgi:hypothetical protein